MWVCQGTPCLYTHACTHTHVKHVVGHVEIFNMYFLSCMCSSRSGEPWHPCPVNINHKKKTASKGGHIDFMFLASPTQSLNLLLMCVHAYGGTPYIPTSRTWDSKSVKIESRFPLFRTERIPGLFQNFSSIFLMFCFFN